MFLMSVRKKKYITGIITSKKITIFPASFCLSEETREMLDLMVVFIAISAEKLV